MICNYFIIGYTWNKNWNLKLADFFFLNKDRFALMYKVPYVIETSTVGA